MRHEYNTNNYLLMPIVHLCLAYANEYKCSKLKQYTTTDLCGMSPGRLGGMTSLTGKRLERDKQICGHHSCCDLCMYTMRLHVHVRAHNYILSYLIICIRSLSYSIRVYINVTMSPI